MKRSLLCSSLALALALGGMAPLQAAEDLPPRDVVLRILAESPAVRAGLGQVQAEQAQQRRLEAGPHEWALRLEGQRRRTQAINPDPASTTRDWAVGLERAWRLPGKAALDEQLGAQGVAVAEATSAGLRQEMARLLLASWFQWLRSKAQWQQVGEEQALLEKEAGSVRRRHELGDAAQLETLQSEAALAQAEARRMAAETEELAARENLQQLFPGLPLPEVFTPAEPQPLEGTLETWLDAQLTHNQALKAARLEAQRSSLQATRVDRERLPDPSVGVRVARERDGEERLLGLTLTIPLSGAARQADADKSLAESSIASQREAQALRQATSEARTTYQRAQSARATWQRSQAAARQMEEAARLQARAYQLGEGSLSELLNARRLAFAATLEARLAQLDALERRYRLLLDSHKLWPFDLQDGLAAASVAP